MNRTHLHDPRPRSLNRVVITGGAGFLGSHLCTELVARGTYVVCLDNFVTGSPANVAHLFILASTSEVYGDPLVHRQPEDYWGNVNPVGPRGVYDEAKRVGEALTTAYRASRGVDTGIVRIFSTYGPRMRPRDGKQTRSVCYVGDLVDGVLAMAQSALAGPINLGSSRALSVRQIAADIVAATGSHSRLNFVGRPIDDPPVRRPDTTLARCALGWEARVPWEQGLSETVAWFASALRQPV
ncbi:MAG TPA: NAD-dependent epimerase/dehydratase family protein [Cellulomonas sp.]|uniref:NAD-dependent epimerase/dehydratase family protein n=1 Tax=Cellulomonas sp. TaxID=40001 RepID=UPI002E305C88|nr:NAD-dependent epimerase/dehydratase family protein [Cellulomonas sp.]HEX5331347.1 NAD-dependent epimerase/dehydratase family protein [Cellulomonas sp.]